MLAIERYWREKNPNPLLPRALAVSWTLLLVMIGWVLFRSTDLGAAWRMLRGMVGVQGVALSPDLAWQITPERVLVMLFGVGLVYALPWLRKHQGGPLRYLLVPLFLWAVATLSSQAFTPFLYFQF